MILTEYDEQKVRNAFYEDGRLEGIDVGLEQKSLEAARNLKEKGIPDEVIAECVGLTLEVVKEL